MRFFLNGREEWLPADWHLHVSIEGSSTRLTVERHGKFMPLDEAFIQRDLESTSSKPFNRTPIPGGKHV